MTKKAAPVFTKAAFFLCLLFMLQPFSPEEV